MTRVGVVGLGRMGAAIARRLLDGGHAVTVHNRTAQKADALVADGASWARTPGALVADADIVLSVLTDDRAVDAVYLGPDGLLTAAQVPGRLFVEMSTVRSSTTLKMHEACAARGAAFVDAPLSGPPEAAASGSLLIVAGGEEAPLERARPLLEALSRRTVHMGPPGAGTTTKLILTLPMAVFFAGMAEAVSIGTQLGLEMSQVLDVFLDTHGAPPVLRDRVPLLLGAQERPAGFAVAGVRKDLEAMIATAQDAGVPASAGSAALALFAAATGNGYADRDLVFVIQYLVELSRRICPDPWIRLASPG